MNLIKSDDVKKAIATLKSQRRNFLSTLSEKTASGSNVRAQSFVKYQQYYTNCLSHLKALRSGVEN
jgi:hypothetical protein